MAPKVLKRPAAGPAVMPAEMTTKKQCKAVVAAIKMAHLPVDVRETLQEAAPHCLEVLKEDRHEYQIKVLNMVSEALAGINESKRVVVDQLTSQLDNQRAIKAQRERSVVEASRDLALKTTDAANKEVELLKARLFELEPSTESLGEQMKETSTGNEEVDQATKEKTKLAEIVKGKLEPMKKEQSTKKQVEALRKQLAVFVPDSSLLTNLSFPLMKPAEERSEFDHMVLQNLDESIAEKEKHLADVLAEGEPARRIRDEALTAAHARYDAAEAKVKEIRAALKAAEAGVVQSEEEFSAAKDYLKQFPVEMQQISAQLAKATDDLTSFRNGPLAALDGLLQRSAPPPAPVTENADAANPEH